MRTATLAALLAGSIMAASACKHHPPPQGPEKSQEILQLWGQIRQWRVEQGLGAEPHPTTAMQWTKQTVKQAQRVCPEGHQVPSTCHDVCNLADAICDNAERICILAEELGTSWAAEKCTSAKASCREAQQRCCNCSETDSKASLEW
jgi:hypothetical protein